MKQVELTEQILRLYYGQPCTIKGDFSEWSGYVNQYSVFEFCAINRLIYPHLRSLSSITEYEAREFWGLSNEKPYEPYNIDDMGICHNNAIEWFHLFYTDWGHERIYYAAAEFLYLTSKGFDLFGLIDAGLAKEVQQ
jgi:hypothetical protein